MYAISFFTYVYTWRGAIPEGEDVIKIHLRSEAATPSIIYFFKCIRFFRAEFKNVMRKTPKFREMCP